MITVSIEAITIASLNNSPTGSVQIGINGEEGTHYEVMGESMASIASRIEAVCLDKKRAISFAPPEHESKYDEE